MMSQHAKQKTFEAVGVLVGDLSISRRVAIAAGPLIDLKNVSSSDVSSDLSPDFLSDLDFIISELTQGGRTNVEVGSGRLSPDNCVLIARKILDLHTTAMGRL